ncbi:MAG: hypothetical protein ABL940_08220 [Bacteroidia bacterium]
MSIEKNASREVKYQKTKQLTLGEFIAEIESVGCTTSNGEYKRICFDFGNFVPTNLHSWRGFYEEIALGYGEIEYNKDPNAVKKINAKDILNELKWAIGKDYQGYKGGEYTMTENTPVWVGNYGDSNYTAVVGVLDNGYSLIILNAYVEF